jgi:phosphoribosylformylglycinamidine cyclo-ligase
MPGFYQPGEYDLAGFAVGIVEKSQILDGSQVRVGDVAIGLASQGIHSNGYSLVRKIVEMTGHQLTDRPAELGGRTLAEALLMPTRIYVKPVLAALRSGLEIHAMAHVTGGGLPENLPRCLGENQSIWVDLQTWEVPSIFNWLSSRGAVATSEMFNTFNMGIGYVLLVPPTQTEQTLQWFINQELPAWAIGEVVEGTGELILTTA